MLFFPVIFTLLAISRYLFHIKYPEHSLVHSCVLFCLYFCVETTSSSYKTRPGIKNLLFEMKRRVVSPQCVCAPRDDDDTLEITLISARRRGVGKIVERLKFFVIFIRFVENQQVRGKLINTFDFRNARDVIYVQEYTFTQLKYL